MKCSLHKREPWQMRTITGVARITTFEVCPTHAYLLLINWITKEAEANRLKLTPEYLELRFIESISNNSKIFFGEKIPNIIMDQRLLRNFLDAGSSKDHFEI